MSATAQRAAVDLHARLRSVVPNLVSVIVGARIDEIPSLVVMLNSKNVSPAIPKRFRGMRVNTCLLSPRRR